MFLTLGIIALIIIVVAIKTKPDKKNTEQSSTDILKGSLKISSEKNYRIIMFHKAVSSGDTAQAQKWLSQSKGGDFNLFQETCLRAIRFNEALVLDALLDFAFKYSYQDSLDLREQAHFALEEDGWGVATVVCRYLCNHNGIEFVKELFEKFYKKRQPKEALVIFCAIPKLYRQEFINIYFKKIMNLCRKDLTYFREAIKVAKEKQVSNTLDAMIRDCYLSLIYAKKKEMTKVLELLLPYLNSKQIDVLKNIHIVYYFYARCLLEQDRKKEALDYFKLVEKKHPNFEDVGEYLAFLHAAEVQREDSYREFDAYLEKGNQSNIPECFKILGLSEIGTKEEIKKAYHRKIAQYHPDKYYALGKKYEDEANEMSKKINQAYQDCLNQIE